MPLSHYEDLVLTADHVERAEQPAGQGEAATTFEVGVFDSPVGQGEQRERVTIPDGFDRDLRWLEQRRLDADLPKQVELGALLGSLLLPSYARGLFRRSLDAIGPDAGLRVRLRLDDQLVDIPWEYAYLDADHGERTTAGFVALDPRVSIVRHEPIAEPVPGAWADAPPARRVVVAMASPEPHDRYRELTSLPDEQRAMKAALGQVEGLSVDYLPDFDANDARLATAEALLAALTSRADIFHFGGHAEFATEMGAAFGSVVGAGSVVLASAANQAELLPAERLAQLVRAKGIRLAVLGACETGRRDGHNVWSSVAAALLRAGVPAVVAMQFTVGDAQAAAFSGALYRALVAGIAIDEAVALGRTAMRLSARGDQADARDWGVPVLYLRNTGGRVFPPVADEGARTAATEASAQLFDQHFGRVTEKGRVFGAVIDSVEATPVEVTQKVDEDVNGLVVGAVKISSGPGGLKVTQVIDTVGEGGVVIGGIVSNRDPMELVKEALGIVEPTP